MSELESFTSLVRAQIGEGDAWGAAAYAQEKVSEFVAAADKKGQATALGMQALATSNLPTTDPTMPIQTLVLAGQASSIFQELLVSDEECFPPMIDAMHLMWSMYMIQNQFGKAADSVKEILRFCKEKDDKAMTASAYLWMAETSQSEGNAAEAVQMAKEALSLYHRVGDRTGKAACHALICDASVLLQDQDEALEASTQAVQLYQEVGDIKGQGKALYAQAMAQNSNGNTISALRATERASNLLYLGGDQMTRVDSLIMEVNLKMQIMGERAVKAPDNGYMPTLKLAQEAVNMARKTRSGDAACMARALLCHAEVLSVMRNYSSARLAAKDAIKNIKKAGGDNVYEAKANLIWCTSDFYLGEHKKALANAQEAMGMMAAIGDSDGKQKADLIAEMSKEQLGIPTRAELIYQQQVRQEEEQRKRMMMMGQGPPPWMMQQMQQQQEQQWPQEQQIQQQANGPLAPGKREGSPIAVSAGMDVEVIKNKITQIVVQIIGDEDEVEGDVPLMAAGLTSNTAVLLRDELTQDLPGVHLPPTLIFDYPSINAIADFVVENAK